MSGKTIAKFMEDTLIREIGEIQQGPGKFVYLSFGLISQGIEFLGSLVDEDEFKDGYSRKRFDLALKKFFPKKYSEFTGTKDEPKEGISLYTELRCGLLHIVIPKGRIVLGEHKNQGHKKHLEIYIFIDGKGNESRKLFLSAEDLYENYKDACEMVVEKLKNGTFIPEYCNRENLSNEKIELLELKRNVLNTELKVKE